MDGNVHKQQMIIKVLYMDQVQIIHRIRYQQSQSLDKIHNGFESHKQKSIIMEYDYVSQMIINSQFNLLVINIFIFTKWKIKRNINKLKKLLQKVVQFVKHHFHNYIQSQNLLF
ncbi:unnamed protein product [Paramecium sonneborni]|uniref:Uncharacterized protein n=1 Tax=Paramecium sonneborni TaxID=65129 RepID=A0A8S1R786_9CILI|nr:unnamed protein product [Paramecium sonneborni]